MKHPALFIVPAFMLADYFLTLVGEIQRGKKYGDHFKAEHCELNPIWQKPVAQRKLFNLRHILLTLVVTAVLMLLMESDDMPEPFAQGMLGCLLVFFGAIIGRHLSNLLIFRRIAQGPNEISGQVTMTHALLLSLSLYQYVVVLIPIALVVAFSPSPFAIGGLLGVVLLLAVHLGWIRRHTKGRKASDEANAGNGR